MTCPRSNSCRQWRPASSCLVPSVPPAAASARTPGAGRAAKKGGCCRNRPWQCGCPVGNPTHGGGKLGLHQRHLHTGLRVRGQAPATPAQSSFSSRPETMHSERLCIEVTSNNPPKDWAPRTSQLSLLAVWPTCATEDAQQHPGRRPGHVQHRVLSQPPRCDNSVSPGISKCPWEQNGPAENHGL